MLRIALIGCGKIADQHVEAINRIGHGEVVAVCDLEPLMAEQLAARFGIQKWFSDAGEMLKEVQPDVVHITTPPGSHFLLARQCIEAGCHVYLEKPFTVTGQEAESLITLAEGRNVLLTAGHNYQYTPEMTNMRRLVSDGFLGGPPVLLESYWSYDLGDTSYVGPVLGNPEHWVRKLPGQLFHNIISHGIARLSEHLDEKGIEVTAFAHQSPTLRKAGVGDVQDELRVLIRDRKHTTAWFSFSTQIKPGLNSLKLYGPQNSLSVDLVSGSLYRHMGRSYKSYLTFFIPPLISLWQGLCNAAGNLWAFVRKQLYHDSGMTELIRRFHSAIEEGMGPPIPYREIRLTAAIMDEIFAQISSGDPTPEIESSDGRQESTAQ